MLERTRIFFRNLVQWQCYGVCASLGEKLRMSSASIRLFFIYASFITFGSPIFVYMGLAFLMDLRKHFRRKRNVIWEF